MSLVKLIFNLLFAVVGWISSAAAIAQICCKNSVTNGYIIFCCIIGIISLIFIFLQIADFIKNKKRVFTHSTSEGVHKYLYNWISTGARTVIFTRDFTWANCDAKMLEMLKAKAINRELIVCLYKSTAITDELESLGAEVYTHNLRNLKSRFTIINYGTVCPRITVGSRTTTGDFLNERYDMRSNPNMYNIFLELFESAKATISQP